MELEFISHWTTVTLPQITEFPQLIGGRTIDYFEARSIYFTRYEGNYYRVIVDDLAVPRHDTVLYIDRLIFDGPDPDDWELCYQTPSLPRSTLNRTIIEQLVQASL